MKLDNGKYDAIILACAGLIRLGLEDRIKNTIDANICLPAVGQGALGIEIRKNDNYLKELINPLIDIKTTTTVLAERAMNSRLEGGCSVPIAGYATIDGEELTLQGMVGNVQSGEILRAKSTGNISEPKVLGESLANKLITMGAKALLENA
jgi:hydroxymethylbilane synthase